MEIPIPTAVTPPGNAKPKLFLKIGSFIGILVVGLIGGYIFAHYFGNIGTYQTANTKSDPIYTEHKALVVGKIIKIDGKNLTVKNKQDIVSTFVISDNLLISKQKKDATFDQTKDVKNIELNKDASISLEEDGGILKIVRIDYLIPYVAPPANSQPAVKASGDAGAVDNGPVNTATSPALINHPLPPAPSPQKP